MIRKTFYNREQLIEMPLNFLRNIDIQTPDEEKMVQEVVNMKVAKEPKLTNFQSQILVPHIKTQEEEKFWQAKLDTEKKEWMSKQLGEEYKVAQLNNEIKELEAQKAEIQKDLPKTDTLDQKGLITLPKAFCQFCSSKGVRHKKVCTRLK